MLLCGFYRQSYEDSVKECPLSVFLGHNERVTRRTVLIVDDEPAIRRILSQYLAAEGHTVIEAATGKEALHTLGVEGGVSATPVDMVLLDIGLPDIDGFDVIARLRQTSSTYVMVVSARTEETDKLVGLNLGADDYVTKPFSVREIAARMKAVFRRMDTAGSPAGNEECLQRGDVVIDTAAREVTVGGEVAELTQLDFDLLVALAESPGRVWSRPQLLEKVWGYDFYGDERVIDVHIGTIRKMLRDDAEEPRYIATVRGVGYKFVPQDR